MNRRSLFRIVGCTATAALAPAEDKQPPLPLQPASPELIPGWVRQTSCPHWFPSERETRLDAALRPDSIHSPCGYAPDSPENPLGSVDAEGKPFHLCHYDVSSCRQRGMYDVDEKGRKTNRFGGCSLEERARLERLESAYRRGAISR